MEEEKCNVLIDGLKLREESIKIQRDKNNLKLGVLIEVFEHIMKENNRLYESLFQGPHFASHPDYEESFYSDLSVTPVDQVVIYMKLQLPTIHNEEFQTDFWIGDSCFAEVTDEPTAEFRRTDEFFTDTCLIPAKVMSVFNANVENCVNLFNRNRAPSLRVTIKGMKEDSSIALEIKNSGGEGINFSLLPVIHCNIRTYPGRSNGEVFNSESSKAILVPKPYDFRNSELAQYLTEKSNQSMETLWQVNMYEAERIFFTDRGCAKEVIKLLKLLRENERWFTLDKYCLKTVVMKMIVENPDQQVWREKMLVKRLKEALENLKESLSTWMLAHRFGPTNMLKTMRLEPLFIDRFADDIIVRIQEILEIIHDDRVDSVEQLRNVFL